MAFGFCSASPTSFKKNFLKKISVNVFSTFYLLFQVPIKSGFCFTISVKCFHQATSGWLSRFLELSTARLDINQSFHLEMLAWCLWPTSACHCSFSSMGFLLCSHKHGDSPEFCLDQLIYTTDDWTHPLHNVINLLSPNWTLLNDCPWDISGAVHLPCY